LTAVLIVPGSLLPPTQPQSTSAAPALRASPSVSAPTATDVAPAPPVSAAPADSALRHCSRVRIVGLQATLQYNERTGVVCGALDEESGRWTVDIAASDAAPAFRILARPANLRLVTSHNFSTEWMDEGGRVWPKNVDFSRQCAKGHALAPLGERGGLADKRLIYRLCHCFCERGCDEAASWLMCSEDAGCCRDYAVCCSCARLPSAAAAASTDSDHFCTLVSFEVERCV
jgi:hypothetical protein